MNYNHILLIDDDRDDREIFVEALREISDSVHCTTSDDAANALLQLRNGTLKPDIIFLDIHMTLISGPEFLRQIKMIAYLKEIPVIILSTHAGQATIDLTKELGAYDYISKPTTFSGMVDILKSIL